MLDSHTDVAVKFGLADEVLHQHLLLVFLFQEPCVIRTDIKGKEMLAVGEHHFEQPLLDLGEPREILRCHEHAASELRVLAEELVKGAAAEVLEFVDGDKHTPPLLERGLLLYAESRVEQVEERAPEYIHGHVVHLTRAERAEDHLALGDCLVHGRLRDRLANDPTENLVIVKDPDFG